VIAEEVFQQYYTATNLEYGKVYTFKVETKTAYAFSVLSEGISMLCAAVPLQIEMPLTVIQGADVMIIWAEPSDQGSPITAYNVMIKNSIVEFI
jgi:hypothetical protein